MKKTLFLLSLLSINSLHADLFVPGPAIECRFGALLENGRVGLDEVAGYPLIPGTGITGNFDPYEFEIAMYADFLSIEVYLDGDAINGIQLPLTNIVVLPVGASIFGLSTVFHDEVEEFVALQYECVKVL